MVIIKLYCHIKFPRGIIKMNRLKYIYTNQDGRQVELTKPFSVKELVLKLKEEQTENQLKHEKELKEKRRKTNSLDLN